MDAVFASGLTAFRSANTRLQSAAGQVAAVRTLTIPAASPQDAPQTRAVAGQRPAPPPPADPGGRAPFSDKAAPNYVDATVDMIRAEQDAKLGVTLIRAADEMTRTVLDIKA